MDKQVNINIGRCRRWKNVSQAALAKSIKSSQTIISNIESGKARVTPKMLARIAGALGMTPDELARGEVR